MNTQIQILDISNFQRLSKAVIEPSGSLIVLAGQNANGKTSVLDAIQSTWCGHNGREIKRPIKDGHGKASIDITMTDGTVLTRKYTPSGTTLTAKAADGSKLVQKDLDRMMSALGVDASAFARAGDKEQLATLLSVVDLPFVPADLDKERKAVEAERLSVGQQGKAIGDVVVSANLPTEETSASEIIASIREAESKNDKRSKQIEYLANLSDKIDRLGAEIKRLTTEKDAAVVEFKEYEPTISSDLIDTENLETQLAEAENTNAAIRFNNAARQQSARKEELRTKYTELSEQIKAIDKTKADGLANAEMPVEGLSFDEEGVLYQGIPFSRASGAEQIIVSAAMIIATDPEMRTMVIRNGNVLDSESMKALEEMLEANHFQAFIEFVSDSDDHEFRLVDGELAE